MKDIKLSLSNNLLSTLQDAFTSTHTTYAEIMQNALRASATSLKVRFDAITKDEREIVTSISFEDNGKGIQDFQSLFTLGETGWDNNVQKKTSPYGVGFLSALTCCEQISVCSCCSMFSMKTADILAMKPVKLVNFKIGEGCSEVTTITLSLLKNEILVKDFYHDIATLAMGYPIPVFLNDEELDRPHSLEVIKKEGAQDVNGVTYRLFGMKEGEESLNESFLYLQGLPVGIKRGKKDSVLRNSNSVSSMYFSKYGKSTFGSAGNIIHLDALKHKARMPDREVLLNSQDVSEQLEDDIKELWSAYLISEKDKLSPEEFLSKHWRAILGQLNYSCFSFMLNDIDFIPSDFFETFDNYPMFEGDSIINASKVRTPNHLISRDTLLNSAVMNELDISRHNSNAEDVNTLIAAMFAYGNDDLVYFSQESYLSKLDKKHWLISSNMIEKFDDTDVMDHFSYALNKPQELDRFTLGSWVHFDVTLCESITITHALSGDKVEIKTDAFILPDGGVAIPDGEATGEVCQQATSYQDEWDNVQDNALEEDELALQRYLRDKRNTDPVELLRDVLNDSNLRKYDKFVNKNFMLSFNDNKELTISLIEKSE